MAHDGVRDSGGDSLPALASGHDCGVALDGMMLMDCLGIWNPRLHLGLDGHVAKGIDNAAVVENCSGSFLTSRKVMSATVIVLV